MMTHGASVYIDEWMMVTTSEQLSGFKVVF